MEEILHQVVGASFVHLLRSKWKMLRPPDVDVGICSTQNMDGERSSHSSTSTFLVD